VITEAVQYSVKMGTLTLMRNVLSLGKALLRRPAACGHYLVLCYHRIAPPCGRAEAVDPIPPDRFAEQMRALRRVGDIIPQADALSAPRFERPAFVITFDDDDPSHVRHALPILRELGIPATFFLSGRSLHHMGPYWWVQLEQAALEDGVVQTARRLGRSARTLKELVRGCRASGAVPELVTRESPPTMQRSDIRTLAEAGMTIGFHTLRHPALTLLNDDDLVIALTDGRDALEDAAGAPVEFFAYPYGHADRRVAAAAQQAGYRAAFTLGDRPVSDPLDRFLLPRWQPGDRTGPDVAAAALWMNRAVRS
jgi:peptidoglycan/xylan/chitin deacetylase (PgdA/CDA1 family)